MTAIRQALGTTQSKKDSPPLMSMGSGIQVRMHGATEETPLKLERIY